MSSSFRMSELNNLVWKIKYYYNIAINFVFFFFLWNLASRKLSQNISFFLTPLLRIKLQRMPYKFRVYSISSNAKYKHTVFTLNRPTRYRDFFFNENRSSKGIDS